MLVSDRKRASTFSIDSIMASEPAKRHAPTLSPLSVTPPIQSIPNYHQVALSSPPTSIPNMSTKLLYDGMNASTLSRLSQHHNLNLLPSRQQHVSELERLAQYPFYSWFMSRQEHFNQHQMQATVDPNFVQSALFPYRKQKRVRTAFSPSQLLQLESAFERNHYLVGNERKDLASELNLTETQVKVWFQNRRTKHKRVIDDESDHTSCGSPEAVEPTSPQPSDLCTRYPCELPHSECHEKTSFRPYLPQDSKHTPSTQRTPHTSNVS